MLIYLQLFWEFFKIGIVSFGGGYAMIPLVQDVVITQNWLTEEMFLNFIAVAESTPGPIALNMATYIGSTQGGLLGSILATLGVVLPSFIIILLIASVMKNLMKYAGVQGGLRGVRPVALGLIFATGVTMTLSTIFGINAIKDGVSFEYKAGIIFAIDAIIYLSYYMGKKKFISPIILIIISAVLGMILYSI